MRGNPLRRYRTVILYGSALAILLFLLKWLEWRFLVFNNALDIYTGAIAVLFTGLGIWLALKLAKPKTVIVPVPAEPAAPPALDEKQIAKLGLSEREREVLQLMAEGLSNQEIAGRLFISLNTIKTHSSRIFEKLDVRRRTQAVEKARRLKVIA